MSERLESGAALAEAAGGRGGPDPARVRELLMLLGKTVRAYQMYEANNPVYERFLESLRAGFEGVWAHVASLRFDVEEAGFRWEGEVYAAGEGRENLAFQFYKDGVRYVTFLPGFEDEVERFLDVVVRARRLSAEEDDLVTLLWEQEFHAFRYGYVDVLAEGVELPEAGPALEFDPIPLESLSLELDSLDPSFASERAGSGGRPASSTFGREDFNETLYFLDEDELDRLRQELDDEWSRDVKPEVLNALFDRLEDPIPERQAEILEILDQLLPLFLARGDLVSASTILRELEAILARGDGLAAEQRGRAEALFDALSEPVALEQLLQSLEEGGTEPGAEALSQFLSWLRPEALPVLFRATETTASAAVRERVRPACDRLAGRHPDVVASLLGSDDDAVAAGAARAAGRLRLASAAPGLIRLLTRRSAATRLVAVEALVAMHTAPAMEGLKRALDDEDREVRIAAARGLGALRYVPARTSLERAIEGKSLRDADLTEKLAFFEAYADLGGAEAVEVLDRLLNGRGGLLGRRQPAELRACAATALGRIGTPAARACLERAIDETDTIVRSAIVRALRRDAPAT
ncbi:MAG TPA: HEAT repeat domain-containing protein [Longimicrobiales bacterium]